jgi:hypothetical protein
MSHPELRRIIRESLALDGNCRDDEEQVGVVGLFAGGGDRRVRLAAVVVEKMGHEQPLRRRNLVVGGEAEPGHLAGERSGGNRTRRRAQNPQDVEQTIGAAQEHC